MVPESRMAGTAALGDKSKVLPQDVKERPVQATVNQVMASLWLSSCTGSAISSP